MECLDVRVLPSAAIYPQEGVQAKAAPPANFNGTWNISSGYSISVTQKEGSKKAVVDFSVTNVPDAKAKIKGETMTIKGKQPVKFTITLTLVNPTYATGTYLEGEGPGAPLTATKV